MLWEDGYFYQDAQYTCLSHNGHPYVSPVAKSLSSAEISAESAFILQQLSVMGVQYSTLSKLLNSMEENDGMFTLKTVQNNLKACNIPKMKELGLAHNISSAEATIEFLHF